jgi:hypothetical protein
MGLVAGLGTLTFMAGLRLVPDKSEAAARAGATEEPTAEAPAVEAPAINAPAPTPEQTAKATPRPPLDTAAPARPAPPPPTVRAAEAPRRPLVLRAINVTLPPNTKPADWRKHGDLLFQHIYLSPDATRLITAANKEAICWDPATGRRLHAFPSPSRSMTTSIAPDARTYVELRADRRPTATVRSTETGHVIGTYSLKKPSFSSCSCRPGFTPAGDFFVFCERGGTRQHYYSTFHVVSTRTGQGRVLTTKIRFGDEDYNLEHQYLQPVPNRPTLLMYFPDTYGGVAPARVCAVDTRTGGVTGFLAMTAKARTLWNTPGFDFKLSADGRLVLGVDGWTGDVQVLDVWTGRLVGDLKKPKFKWSRHDALLTPDLQRVVTLEQPESGHRNWFYLHNLATGQELGGFDATELGLTEQDEAEKLRISRDGRILAVMFRHKVVLVDFEAAFRTKPLPPVLVGAETLP